MGRHLAERDGDVGKGSDSRHDADAKGGSKPHHHESLPLGTERLGLEGPDEDDAVGKEAACGHVQHCEADGDLEPPREEDAVGEDQDGANDIPCQDCGDWSENRERDSAQEPPLWRFIIRGALVDVCCSRSQRMLASLCRMNVPLRHVLLLTQGAQPSSHFPHRNIL